METHDVERSAVERSPVTSTDYAIEVTNLRKSFGKVEVLKGLNLQVKRGSLLALLGPNGAGKTTTIRILSTLIRRTLAVYASSGTMSCMRPMRCAVASA